MKTDDLLLQYVEAFYRPARSEDGQFTRDTSGFGFAYTGRPSTRLPVTKIAGACLTTRYKDGPAHSDIRSQCPPSQSCVSFLGSICPCPKYESRDLNNMSVSHSTS